MDVVNIAPVALGWILALTIAVVDALVASQRPDGWAARVAERGEGPA